MPDYSIYIHIPYCLNKCPYCNFNSYPLENDSGIPQDYIMALKQEIMLTKEIYDFKNHSLISIYLGGGTPSLLKPDQLCEIFSCIDDTFGRTKKIKTEITIEVNPGSQAFNTLEKYQNFGVNRFIIGVQSFQDENLRKLDRIHDSADSIELLDKIKSSSIDNWGLDLIYGIPSQTSKSWAKDLETAVSYKPQHISAYNLTLEENTPFEGIMRINKWHLKSDEENFTFFQIASDFLKKQSYNHYEISNFSQKGFHSVHNSHYWERGKYFGFGAGAHSFIKETNKRSWNIKNPQKYIKSLKENIIPVENSEILSDKSSKLEKLYLNMRTSKGLNLNFFEKEKSLKEFKIMICNYKELGLITVSNNYIKPTLKGLFISDSLTLKLADFI